MKTFFQITLITILITGLSGCAMHDGYMGNSATLSTNNFKYVKRDVQGTAKVFYVFGIGGLKPNALVNEAKKNMLQNYMLQDNQALVDLTVNWKTLNLGVFMSRRCTVTASIVEFNK